MKQKRVREREHYRDLKIDCNCALYPVKRDFASGEHRYSYHPREDPDESEVHENECNW